MFKVVFGLLFSFLDFFIPKIENMAIFAGQRGLRYFDNSRYLYEYYRDNVADTKVYWLSLSKENHLGKDARHIYAYSWQGLWIALRSKTAFASYGCADFGMLRFSKSKVFVQLWHGAPLKTIFLGQRELHLSVRLKNIYELSRFSFFVVSSAVERLAVSQQTGLPLDRVKILGYPRNDILKTPDKHTIENVERLRLGYSKVILFAPTFRESGESPFSSISVATWEGICSYLKRNNFLLIVRSHATEFLFKMNDAANSVTSGYANITFAANDVYPDVQELMLASDVLISDYSGIIFDYLLLERPIIRFIYDEPVYEAERGLLYLADDLTIGTTVRSESELLQAIGAALATGSVCENSKMLRKIFHSPRESGACKTIVDFVNEQLRSHE